MSFALAAETLGLGTCLINWPDHESRERQMAELLGLESDERPIMCIAVGHPAPDGLIACSQKKLVDQLRRYN
jgi:nitroreductase